MRYNLACILTVALHDDEASLEVLQPYFERVNTAPQIKHTEADPDFIRVRDMKGQFGDLKVKLNTDDFDLKLDTRGDSDIYVTRNAIAVDGQSGWHTHPGPSLVIVTQGTVTEYDGDDPSCTPHVYSASGTNSFVDIGSGAVHIIRDESGSVAKTVVVQLIQKAATRRIDVTPAPGNCSF